MSVNLGEYVFEDVDVLFGLDFDPRGFCRLVDNFDAGPTSEDSYTIFDGICDEFDFPGCIDVQSTSIPSPRRMTVCGDRDAALTTQITTK